MNIYDIFTIYHTNYTNKWDKIFKSGLSKFFKGCLPQNLLSPLLNTLSQIHLIIYGKPICDTSTS